MSTMQSFATGRPSVANWLFGSQFAPDASAGDAASAAKQAMIETHTQAMDALSAERRIDYLAEQGFSETDIQQLLNGIRQVVDQEYGPTIWRLAAVHAQQGNSLNELVEDILETNIITDLVNLVVDLAVASTRRDAEGNIIAAIYANREFYYTVNAALYVARMDREKSGSAAASDLQCIERDQALADVGLTEDARLWPES